MIIVAPRIEQRAKGWWRERSETGRRARPINVCACTEQAIIRRYINNNNNNNSLVQHSWSWFDGWADWGVVLIYTITSWAQTFVISRNCEGISLYGSNVCVCEFICVSECFPIYVESSPEVLSHGFLVQFVVECGMFCSMVGQFYLQTTVGRMTIEVVNEFASGYYKLADALSKTQSFHPTE